MKILILRNHDSVIVWIMKNKNDDTFSFVNLTKGHICPCRFRSVDEAMDDLRNQKISGKVKEYYTLPDHD